MTRAAAIPVTPKWSPQVSALYDALRCDHAGCKTPPLWSLVLVVQSRTPADPAHAPLVWTTGLHACEDHKGSFTPEMLLTDRRQAMIEAHAKRNRPQGFVCDFGFSCFVDCMDVFGDRYRQRLESVARGMAKQLGCLA